MLRISAQLYGELEREVAELKKELEIREPKKAQQPMQL